MTRRGLMTLVVGLALAGTSRSAGPLRPSAPPAGARCEVCGGPVGACAKGHCADEGDDDDHPIVDHLKRFKAWLCYRPRARGKKEPTILTPYTPPLYTYFSGTHPVPSVPPHFDHGCAAGCAAGPVVAHPAGVVPVPPAPSAENDMAPPVEPLPAPKPVPSVRKTSSTGQTLRFTRPPVLPCSTGNVSCVPPIYPAEATADAGSAPPARPAPRRNP